MKDVYPCTITIHARNAQAFVSLTRLGPLYSVRGPEAAELEQTLLQGLVEASLAVPK